MNILSPMCILLTEDGSCFVIIVASFSVGPHWGVLFFFDLPINLLLVVMFISIPGGVWLSVLFDDWHNKQARTRAEQEN